MSANGTAASSGLPRILIPGGAGYIGSHVVLSVLLTRRYRVTGKFASCLAMALQAGQQRYGMLKLGLSDMGRCPRAYRANQGPQGFKVSYWSDRAYHHLPLCQ